MGKMSKIRIFQNAFNAPLKTLLFKFLNIFRRTFKRLTFYCPFLLILVLFATFSSFSSSLLVLSLKHTTSFPHSLYSPDILNLSLFLKEFHKKLFHYWWLWSHWFYCDLMLFLFQWFYSLLQ